MDERGSSKVTRLIRTVQAKVPAEFLAAATGHVSGGLVAAIGESEAVFLPLVVGHLPQRRRLNDLLDQLFEGAHHALARLRRGLDEHHLEVEDVG